MFSDEALGVWATIGALILVFIFGVIPAYESLFSSRGYFTVRECVSNDVNEVCFVSDAEIAISHSHQFVVVRRGEHPVFKFKNCDVLSESQWDCENMRALRDGVWGNSEFKPTYKTSITFEEEWAVAYFWRWATDRSEGCLAGPVKNLERIKKEDCLNMWLAVAQ